MKNLAGLLSRAAIVPSRQQGAFIDGFAGSEKGTAHVLMARAGTGKTFTILKALSRLPPGESTLVMVYNARNREEMKKDAPVGARAEIHTYHSFALACCRAYWPHAINSRNNERMRKSWNTAKKIIPTKYRSLQWPAKTVADLAKELGVGICVEDTDELWLSIIAEYNVRFPRRFPPELLASESRRLFWECIRNTSELDFGDMLWHAASDQVVLPRFDNLIVDEVQDTNPLQARLIEKLMAGGTTRLAAAGDPYQAIYGWRGAGTSVMSDLVENYKAQTYPLTATRRCPVAVVDTARRIVSDFEALPEAPQGDVVIMQPAEFKQTLSSLPEGTAVLCRNNAPLMRAALEAFSAGVRVCLLGQDLIWTATTYAIEAFKIDPRLNDDSYAGLRANVREEYADRPFALSKALDGIEVAQAITNHLKNLGDGSVLNVDRITDLTQQIEHYAARLIFKDPQENSVVFSSIHKAKGLEWPFVVLIEMEKLPSLEARKMGGWHLEQERNLLYVAVTRAKDTLIMVSKSEDPLGTCLKRMVPPNESDPTV